jgi:hypothetical protein
MSPHETTKETAQLGNYTLFRKKLETTIQALLESLFRII